MVKPPEEDEQPHPTASSSNDPTIPLPTTTHSFTPSPAVPVDDADLDCDTPQSGSQDTIQYHDPEDETEEPVLNGEASIGRCRFYLTAAA